MARLSDPVSYLEPKLDSRDLRSGVLFASGCLIRFLKGV